MWCREHLGGYLLLTIQNLPFCVGPSCLTPDW